MRVEHLQHANILRLQQNDKSMDEIKRILFTQKNSKILSKVQAQPPRKSLDDRHHALGLIPFSSSGSVRTENEGLSLPITQQRTKP
jgi:hypothetical protein